MAQVDFASDLETAGKRKKLEQRMRARQEKKNKGAVKNIKGKPTTKKMRFKDSEKCKSLMSFDGK